MQRQNHRTRMSWDWVGTWPVFIYTTWLDNNKFHVKIVLGVEHDQNAGYNGPNAPAWLQYTDSRYASKNEVVKAALKLSEKLLKPSEEKHNKTECVNLLNFGKHKGKFVHDVLADDPSYLCWLVDNEVVKISESIEKQARSAAYDEKIANECFVEQAYREGWGA